MPCKGSRATVSNVGIHKISVKKVIEQRDFDGHTVIHIAAAEGRTDIINRIISVRSSTERTNDAVKQ